MEIPKECCRIMLDIDEPLRLSSLCVEVGEEEPVAGLFFPPRGRTEGIIGLAKKKYKVCAFFLRRSLTFPVWTSECEFVNGCEKNEEEIDVSN